MIAADRHRVEVFDLSAILPGCRRVLMGAGVVGLLILQTAVLWAEDRGAGDVSVTDLEGRVHTGSLQKLGGGQLLLGGERPRTFALDQLIRIDWAQRRASVPAADSLLFLANGDRLVLRPQRLDEESLTGEWVKFPAWPPIRIPLETIRGALLTPPLNRLERIRFANQILDQTELQDVLFLSNGDRTTGELRGLDPTTVKFEAAVGQIELERQAVRGFGFNPELTSFPEPAASRAILVLEDGSRLTVHGLALDDQGKLKCQAAFGGELTIPVEQVVTLCFLGGKLAYLSDLEPQSYRFTPYLSARWPLRRDRSALGGPLTLRNAECVKGLGMHSQSEVSYFLNGKYRRFRAVLGIDDETAGAGSVVFRVLADGQQIYRSDTVRGNAPPIVLEPLDITGVKVLVLIVDFADQGDIQDHADWCDALLVE